MAIYFEKRTYARSEIAEIFKFDSKDKNFARKVKTKLENLGFTEEDYIYTRKNITILWVPTNYAEKITYLVRLLGIDLQVDPYNFAMFLYGLIETEDLQTMPWAERSSWMKDTWGIEISERTLRKWTSKLLELGILTKEKGSGKWWFSTKFNGETYRNIVTTEEDFKEMQEYWRDWREWRQTMPYKDVFAKLWNKYNCTFYKCPELLGCAWNQPIVMELI